MSNHFEEERLRNVQTFLDQQSAPLPVTPDPLREAALWAQDADHPGMLGGRDCMCEGHLALRAALASQPVTRGQEAAETCGHANECVCTEAGHESCCGTRRERWLAALRGQVREGIDVETCEAALTDFVYAYGSDFDAAAYPGMAALQARLQGLSGGEGE